MSARRGRGQEKLLRWGGGDLSMTNNLRATAAEGGLKEKAKSLRALGRV